MGELKILAKDFHETMYQQIRKYREETALLMQLKQYESKNPDTMDKADPYYVSRVLDFMQKTESLKQDPLVARKLKELIIELVQIKTNIEKNDYIVLKTFDNTINKNYTINKGGQIMDNSQYGSVITEQGDLGFGVTPINEQETPKNEEKENKKDK